jgi:hypothetical protein
VLGPLCYPLYSVVKVGIAFTTGENAMQEEGTVCVGCARVGEDRGGWGEGKGTKKQANGMKGM